MSAQPTASQLEPAANQQPILHLNNNQPPTASSASNPSGRPRGRRKKIRTEPVRPICPQCEKQFSNQSALTKHKLTHSDERKFACQQCSKAFKRHDHLTGHMQTHSNRKPFNCTIQGCDKTYCDARSLRRHKENIHHIVQTVKHSPTTPSLANGSASSNSNSSSASSCTTTNCTTTATTNNNIANNHLNLQSPSQFSGQPQSGLDPSQQQQLLELDHQQPQQQLQPHIQHHHLQPHQHQQNQQLVVPHNQQACNSLSSSTGHLAEPHLLRRRMQRLHSDSGVYGETEPSGERANFMPRPIDPHPHHFQHHSLDHNPQVHHNPNHQQHQQHQHHQHQQHQHYQHQQASYSADYARTERFSFDVNHIKNQEAAHLNGSGSSVPLHSADSVADSGLGMNAPQHQQLVLSHNPQQACNSLSSSTGHLLEPHLPEPPLLRRRMQRLHSDSGVYADTDQSERANFMPRPIDPNPPHYQHQHQQQQQQQHQHHNNFNHQQQIHHNHNQQQQQHYQHQSYSADYARPQRFLFDANHIRNLDEAHLDGSGSVPLHSADSVTDSGLGMNLQAPYSADYAHPSHFSFELNHFTNLDEPQLSGSMGSIPSHSADSVTDSGLGLNVQYEQQMTPNQPLHDYQLTPVMTTGNTSNTAMNLFHNVQTVYTSETT